MKIVFLKVNTYASDILIYFVEKVEYLYLYLYLYLKIININKLFKPKMLY